MRKCSWGTLSHLYQLFIFSNLRLLFSLFNVLTLIPINLSTSTEDSNAILFYYQATSFFLTSNLLSTLNIARDTLLYNKYVAIQTINAFTPLKGTNPTNI